MIADTSVWIEFLKGREPVYSRLERSLRRREAIAVECVFGELLQGVRNRAEAAIIHRYWENLPKIDEEGIWIEAGRMSAELKLHAKGVGLIDLAILAAARRSQERLWTLDRKLKNLLAPAEAFEPDSL